MRRKSRKFSASLFKAISLACLTLQVCPYDSFCGLRHLPHARSAEEVPAPCGGLRVSTRPVSLCSGRGRHTREKIFQVEPSSVYPRRVCEWLCNSDFSVPASCWHGKHCRREVPLRHRGSQGRCVSEALPHLSVDGVMFVQRAWQERQGDPRNDHRCVLGGIRLQPSKSETRCFPVTVPQHGLQVRFANIDQCRRSFLLG